MYDLVEGGGLHSLDSLCPSEPKGKKPNGLYTLFCAHQEKTKVQFHPLKQHNCTVCVQSTNLTPW